MRFWDLSAVRRATGGAGRCLPRTDGRRQSAREASSANCSAGCRVRFGKVRETVDEVLP